MESYRDSYELILSEIQKACETVDAGQISELIDAILSADRVFLTGAGRVALSLMAMCKRLNHLGIEAHCVGDIDEPRATEKSLLIVGSGSGESAVPLAIAGVAKRYGVKVCHIGSNPHGSMEKYADIFVRIPVKTKLSLAGELESGQLMSSLFEQSLYIVCDSVCYLIAKNRGMDTASLWRHHANLE